MQMDQEDNDDVSAPSHGLAATRSRRERKDKTGRKAVLEKLRAAKSKGERVKYEVREIDNVYDEVDEREYAKNVRKRQDDDWIVDDGGDYFEDGREIFDDEQDEDGGRQKIDIEENVKKSRKESKKKIKLVKSNDIKNMLTNMGARKKTEKSADLGQDELLGDILQEISTAENQPLAAPIRPVQLKKKKVMTPSEFSSPYEAASIMSDTMSPPSSLNHKRIKPRRIMAPAPIADPDKNLDVKQEPVTPPAKRTKIDVGGVSVKKEHVEETSNQEIQHNNSVMEIADIDFDDEFGSSQEKKPAATEIKKVPVMKAPQLSSLGWADIKKEADDTSQVSDVVVDSSQLPLVTDAEGNKVFRFYWLDAYEDIFQKPGTVYLFGKVYIESAKAHVSCCLTVKNIQRHLYLLPREQHRVTGEVVSLQDVYKEFDSAVAEKYRIMKFKTKIVEKKYVFGESDIPEHSQYLEIMYPPEFQVLPQDLSGDTFSHAFGTNQSALESFLIRRGIHGPSWMDVKMPQLNAQPVSWCKVEAWTSTPLNVTPVKDIPAPPLIVLTIATKTLPNLKTHQNELIGIAGLVHNQFYIDKAAPKPPFQRTFCALCKPSDCVFPFDFRNVIKKRNANVEVLPTERSFLAYFLAKVQKLDPDVIIGHNVTDFDLDVLLHRISSCKVANWSRIGRLRRANLPKIGAGGRFLDRAVTCGRILCDVKTISKELIRCKNYELGTLTEQVLHKRREDVQPELIKNMFSSSDQLMWLIEHTWIDANLALNVACELNALPLALQITTIAGNVLSRTLMGGRSERNEFLLLHAFHEKGFIPPDKVYKKKGPPQKNQSHDDTTAGESGRSKNKKAKSYAGGLVLEPKKGFYDQYILLLDFNSLYPSIIQEYNICFTTLDRHPPEGAGIDEDTYIPDVPETGLEAGILPTEIKKLVDRRREVKKLMKNPSLTQDEYTQYNIRQQALKLTANSMYGCLGFSNSRFYAKPLAALVTRQGREILMHTKELAQKMNLEVIYGDTDSIMINTNSKDLEHVFKLGNQVKAEVNKLYRLLEIDIDGVFKSMLLLKKKKYAALTVHKNPDGSHSTKKELKGLDIVRRDWSELAKLAGNFAVDEILSDQPRETIVENIHTKLQEIGGKVRAGEYPIEVYTINKELTKDPQHYPGKNNLSHVIVALRLNNNMSRHLKSGDVVSYVICKDDTNNPATQRAYAIEEVQKNDKLKIDEDYYLSQQVHPVVMRLCEPIDGTDSAHIAQCLGLDPSGYKQSMAVKEEDEEDRLLSFQASEEERFSDCAPIIFTCPETKKQIIMNCGVFAETDPTWKPTLAIECGNGDSKMVCNFLSQFRNQVTQQIRADIDKYYKGWLSCDDPACLHRTRLVPTIYDKQGPPCPACERGILRQEYSYKKLFQQLCYYKLQFDVDYALKKYKQDPNNSRGGMRVQDHRASYKSLTDIVDQYLNSSAYNEVSLPHLFSWMIKVK